MINSKKSFLFFFIFLLSINHNATLASEIENVKIGPFFLGQKYTLSEFGKYKSFDNKFYKNTNFNSKVFRDKTITGNYEEIQVGYWKDNKKIVAINGHISYPNKLQKCLDKKEEVTESIKQSFSPNDYNISYKDGAHNADKTGKSIQYTTYLRFINGISISIYCMDWTKKIEKKQKWADGLNVQIYYRDELKKIYKLHER